jgi:hypothetical protein
MEIIEINKLLELFDIKLEEMPKSQTDQESHDMTE